MKNYLKYSIILLGFILTFYLKSESSNPLSATNSFESVRVQENTLGYGLMSDNVSINKRIAGDSCVVSTKFMYVYLSEVIDDWCINDSGLVDEGKIKMKLKNCLDRKLDFKSNKRYVLRVFPSCNASGPVNGAKLLSNVKTDDGKLYLWYPEKLYKREKNSKYPPIVLKWNKSKNFKETNNLSVIDFRNPTFYHMYESVIKVFSEYLKESVESPSLSSYTNALQKCTKGNFISRIEIGFLGPWGEGLTTFYKDYNDSKALISMVELYKKYLSEYWLVAPSFGMCKMGTSNFKLYDFEYYLMTTTYGSEVKNDKGFLMGDKEFGLFIDHLGSSDCQNDFNITNKYNKNELKEILKKKYLNAPIIGENNGQIGNESKNITSNINDMGISMLRVWGKIEDVDNSSVEKWKEAIGHVGFRIEGEIIQVLINSKEIKVELELNNKEKTPCYDDYWRLQLVIRRKKDNKSMVVENLYSRLNEMKNGTLNIISFINLAKLPTNEHYYLSFRIIDCCHINENLIVQNLSKIKGGEYLIKEFKY